MDSLTWPQRLFLSDDGQLEHTIKPTATNCERREHSTHCSEPQVTPESLEDDAKAQMKNVKAAGHKDIRWCGAYKVRATATHRRFGLLDT